MGFAANLPGLGKVSMHFEESKSHEIGGGQGCKGKPTVFRKGGVEVEASTSVDTGSYLWHVPGWPGGTLTDANAEPPA